MKIEKQKLTWSLVLTTHNGFVDIDVAAPAPAAAIIFPIVVSSWQPSAIILPINSLKK